jgi:hypothetical protein
MTVHLLEVRSEKLVIHLISAQVLTADARLQQEDYIEDALLVTFLS